MNDNNDELDLKDLLNIFWEKKLIIIIITLIAIVVGFVYTIFFKEPLYTASCTLILAQKDGGESSSVTQNDISLNDKLIATYKELAKSNTVVREVIKNLNMSKMTEEKLKSEININAVKETQILKISVTDEDPAKAQSIANKLSEVFVKKVMEIYRIDNINIVDDAELPTNPSNINHKKDIAIFTAGGLVLSILIVFLIDVLDATVKSPGDIEKSIDIMVLAEIPECNFEGKKLI